MGDSLSPSSFLSFSLLFSSFCWPWRSGRSWEPYVRSSVQTCTSTPTHTAPPEVTRAYVKHYTNMHAPSKLRHELDVRRPTARPSSCPPSCHLYIKYDIITRQAIMQESGACTAPRQG